MFTTVCIPTGIASVHSDSDIVKRKSQPSKILPVLYVTVYAEIDDMSPDVIFRYGPRRSKRYVW